MLPPSARDDRDTSHAPNGSSGPPPSQWSRHSGWHYLRVILAILLAVACVTYSVVWMYYIRKGPVTTMGLRLQHNRDLAVDVTFVVPNSPAAQAGIAVGDKVVSVNGHQVRSMEPIFAALTLSHPGDHILLAVTTPGSTDIRQFDLVLGRAESFYQSTSQFVAGQLVSSFPVLFILVGIPVLFLRLDDRNAWMVAICFTGMVASAPVAQQLGLMPPPLRAFMAGFMVFFFSLEPAAFYYLFATFPIQSPIDAKVPWLKNVLLFGMAAIALSVASVAVYTQSLEGLWPLTDFFGRGRIGAVFAAYSFGAYGLALLSLVWNSFRATDREARRKTRVIVWGTVLAMLPWLILMLCSMIFRIEPYNMSFWLWAPAVLMIFLLPLSFAYAVLKHRVLDVPVLLRRSARYLLVQRGFLILIVVLGTAATLALAHSFSLHFPERAGAAIPVGAGFGIALVFGGAWIQQRVSRRVDKAFFRSSYDTRQILEGLLAKTREVRTREQLSQLLTDNLHDALHPAFLLIYLAKAGKLNLRNHGLPDAPPTVDNSPTMTDLFNSAEPMEVLPKPEHAEFARLGAESLVPITGRERQRLGLLVLGPRLSEEPYSREDKRLLALIATSAGGALENIELAEDIAQRMESEKRAAHEIELARQVQRKLFPQNPPHLAHLDFAGECVQTRAVGGDYYDFLELAPGIVGFALADISGKGFAAALLMANLQANLRGQYAVALDDLPGLMCSVNRLFFENSEPQHYATMFFGIFDDARRTLRYVNCGHNPPLLLHADSTVEELPATATVMGLFREWQCTTAETQLSPGDLFVLYTDGVTEACVDDGEEFGEQRLVETLLRHRQQNASDLLRTLVQTIEAFSPGDKSDDLTAVIAKVC